MADGDQSEAVTAPDAVRRVPVPPHRVLGIDHVGIAVADLDTAIELYESAFAMRCVHQEVNTEQGVREAMLQVGDSDSYVQLLAPLSPDSTIGRFLDRNGPGIQQLAYRVDSIDEVSAHLRSQGMRLLYDEPRTGTAGSRVNFVHPKSAGGVLVELVEPGPESVGDS
jgi:methylmalonyl-CoA/ethylmalonyl-CoA epimerase